MILMDGYRKLLGVAYRTLFGGTCRRLRVTGFLTFYNPKSVIVGDGVFIKKGTELVPSGENSHVEIGNNTVIHEDCVLKTSRKGYIRIGENCSINRGSYVIGSEKIIIGNYVRIGPRANIVTNNHIFLDPDLHIMDQGIKCSPVTIQSDVWIGINVTILPGVFIGEGSVITAGAVVNRNVPPYSVVGGVPAKVIKRRTNKDNHIFHHIAF